jgi:3'-phosphoadenosine 5'-phosphosulfate sulfotransferase (PAPS reductase)/FAD synthetase
MKHIIFYSGGIGSYFAAKRVLEKHRPEDVILLFTDTLIEDKDLYRFLDETSKKLGVVDL